MLNAVVILVCVFGTLFVGHLLHKAGVGRTQPQQRRRGARARVGVSVGTSGKPRVWVSKRLR